jgi:signal transduction histidine kinase/ligand-binding sensor domain-containing protein
MFLRRRRLLEFLPVQVIVAALANQFVIQPAAALDPHAAMNRYLRKSWGSEQGYHGGPVYALAQTPDGYLWIGNQKGLIRFDGLSFSPASNPRPSPTGAEPVLGLATDSSGTLWIRTRDSTLLRYSSGDMREFRVDVTGPEAGITAMGPASDGGVLLSTFVNGVLKLEGKKKEKLSSTSTLPNFLVLSIAQASDGKVWLGTRDLGLFSLFSGRISAVSDKALDPKINCLLATGDREVWIGTDSGVARWDGNQVTMEGVPPLLQGLRVLAMLRDRASNFWFATSRGLVRFNDRGAVMLEQDAPERAKTVTAVFEDREGNIWIGGAAGIERLRDSAFITYSPTEGLPSYSNGPVFADAEGRTWFAPVEGGLYWLKEGKTARVAAIGNDVVYSIAGSDDELWIGRQTGGLTRLRYETGLFSPETFTQKDGLAQNSVYSVHRARDGTVWAGTLSGGASRLRSGRITTYTIRNGLASNTIASILEGSDGTIWFATPNGLSGLLNGRWESYAVRDGLPSANVNCLLEDSNGVLWIGTANGLAFRESGRVRSPARLPLSLKEQILGLTEDGRGSLWVATSHHVLRVNRKKLFDGTLEDGDVREYGTADGLQGVEGVKRHRSVAADSAGRVWFSMNRGLSVVDPTRLAAASAATVAHVQAILADGVPVPLENSIQVPAGRQRITFRYAGLSLSVPERVQFRHRLEEYDQDWNGPTLNREATYTNLGPGSYRFRVLASNPDGVWNGTEASVALQIAPLFWQTWVFRTGVAVAVAGAIVLLYRIRIRRIAHHLNLRFEERLAERTRIAQELHDTLLQGFLSASMQLHVSADRLPEDSPVKPSVNRVLQLMSQVIDEGRNAVRGLRADSASLDLAEAFSLIREELGADDRTGFRVIVEGQPRPLHPVLRDEIYRIGREALVNAFRHSRADTIEMALEYELRRFRLLVRDNGCGIDPSVLRSGREGHWGLPGMRERAERIGGQFHVWSSASAGTEVELSVPGAVAFQERSSIGWMRRIGLWDFRKARDPAGKAKSGAHGRGKT